MLDRAESVHHKFMQRVLAVDLPAPSPHSYVELSLSPDAVLSLFESQLLSRQLDLHSRKLQARGESFYTIGSSGHEGNAAIAAALRLTDMALLHYRDAAFMIERSKQLPGHDAMRDMLLSFAASKDDPISGGRHKVLGSKALFIPPQTSTIASHLPKAVGLATSIGLNKRLGRQGELPQDGLVMCSFGDASLNHSTAQGAINTASWMAYQKLHLPLLWVCEDNGIGISTPTPDGWVHASMAAKPGIFYRECNGLDLLDTYLAAKECADYIRTRRLPAFLHMRCVRLLGHAGADAQHTYLPEAAIEETESHDPLLYSAATLIAQGLRSPEQIVARYQAIGEQIAQVAEEVITRPKLITASEVMESIVPPKRKIVPAKKPSPAERDALFGEDVAALSRPQNMARLINLALADLMLEHPQIVMAGEDIGAKGGVYSVTSKLASMFGSHRVINTLLDEQTILGLSIGMAQNGLLPIPEIQFLAYLHNAEDQLRGEAATLSFFSCGQYTNPMVIRIAGLAYQKGFGGHFHNDNSVAVLRDIPGIIVACPSHGRDAVAMLRECVRLAHEEQRVVVFLEPIALYMTRDLHEAKDGLWSFAYDEALAAPPVSLGQVACYGKGADLCILTYGNGYYLSRQAQKILQEQHQIDARVVDLRWLAPLDIAEIVRAIGASNAILIVEECRITGSLSDTLMAQLTEHMPGLPPMARVAATDSFIPLGRAATATLPSRDSIVQAAIKLARPQTRAKSKKKA